MNEKFSSDLKLQIDNRGSAVVMVIVALAFVSALVAALFWVTTANALMKYTDIRIRRSFYSAETIAEEMRTGIQSQASKSMSLAYINALEEFTGTFDQTEFTSQYLKSMSDVYKLDSDDSKFSMEVLKSYVNTEALTKVTAPILEDPADHEMIIDTDEATLTLKNVHIIYTADDGVVSDIKTDFVVSTPKGMFNKGDKLSDYFTFSLIADKYLRVFNGTTVNLFQNAFGGNIATKIGQGKKEGNASSAILNLMQGAKYYITGGTVELDGFTYGTSGTGGTAGQKAYLMNVSENRLYATDVRVDKGDATLNGNEFVLDDFTFAGPGTLSVYGNYLGYGNKVGQISENSALMVNSRNVKLDLSNAKNFELSGRSFLGEVNDSKADQGNNAGTGGYSLTIEDKPPILMNRSIAVKADQVAYLIPPECVGVVANTGDILCGSNPVVGVTLEGKNIVFYDEYLKYKNDHLVFYGAYQTDKKDYAAQKNEAEFKQDYQHEVVVVDFDHAISDLGGHSLSEYSHEYRVMYKRQYGQTLAYFYIILDEDAAERYERDFYAVDKNEDRDHRYYDYYVNKDSVVGSDKDNVSVRGTYLDRKDGAYEITEDESFNAIEAEAKYQKYVAEYNELVRTHRYDYIISENALQNFVPENGTRYFVDGEGDDKVRAVVTRQATFAYDGNSSDNSDIRLIISEGDVTVKGDFNGLIIAKGDIIMDDLGNTININPAHQDIARLLQSSTEWTESGEKEAGTKCVFFFKDGRDIVYNGVNLANSSGVANDELEDYGDLVRYANWEKR